MGRRVVLGRLPLAGPAASAPLTAPVDDALAEPAPVPRRVGAFNSEITTGLGLFSAVARHQCPQGQSRYPKRRAGQKLWSGGLQCFRRVRFQSRIFRLVMSIRKGVET